MLFHIKHTHSHETCPAGQPEMIRTTFGAVVSEEHARKVGAKLLGCYADAPAHVTYFIVEADTAEKVGAFLAPLLKLGFAEIRPVTNLVEEVKRKLEEAKRAKT